MMEWVVWGVVEKRFFDDLILVRGTADPFKNNYIK